ncbi:MAG: T9SS type A sorting domain-containing protein [Salinivirgaceae bacterium]|nr:T9SS type A sorting domain-containing protein [Salinivirgaceae bacterium]
MRKITFISIVMVLAVINTHAADAWEGAMEEFTEGDGSKESPYIIGTANELAFMSYVVSAGTQGFDTLHYKLIADIDLNNQPWFSIGEARNPFKGVFDGNNHTISNMNVADSSAETRSIGLFGYSSGATIKNITVKGIVKSKRSKSITSYCGGICGYAKNTVFYNCHNECIITDNAANETLFECIDSSFVGGICGYAEKSDLAFCHNSGALSTESVTENTNESILHVGGICGKANNTRIKCCCNNSTILVKSAQTSDYITCYNRTYHYAGGICGCMSNNSDISSTYNVGKLTNNYLSARNGNDMPSTKYAGGICGFANQSSTTTNSSFEEHCCESSTYGGTKTNANSMQTNAFIMTLNSENPCAFVPDNQSQNGGYPVLNTIYEIITETKAGEGITVNGADFFNGKEITIKAHPAVGYHFVKWTDGNDITDSVQNIIVSRDSVFGAIFEINQYTVSVDFNEGMGTVSGAAEYNHGDTVSLVAAAKIGYKFANWNGGIQVDSISFIIENDTTITASFDKLYKASAAASDSAKGFVAIAGLDKNGFCGKDSVVTFTANAKAGFRFVKWTDGDTANPRAVSIKSDTTLNAYFAKCHTVTTLSDNEWGYVEGGGIYEHDSTALLLAVATQYVTGGFGFLKWNDGNRENPRRITVTKDTLLAAIFTTHDTVYVHDTTYIHDTINVASVTSKEVIDVSIYPNPTISFVNVSASKFFSYILTDARGVVLKREDENTSFIIDMSEYADGVYFITTSDGITHKIVKN